MKTTLRLLMLAAVLLAASAAHANSETYCGNSLDDDGDGFTDEGCYPDVNLGVCESPLPCATAGAPEPNGGVRLPRPPDLAAIAPYGVELSFERFYTSHYYLQGNGGTYEKPMGPGFQHSYMSWLKAPAAQLPTNTPTQVVMHARTGQDIKFNYSFADSTWRWYTPQAGYYFKALKQRKVSPYDWELENLDGTGTEYDWNQTTGLGRMIAIQDSLATPNRTKLTYNAANQVDNVLDATGKRELALTYVSGYLTEVALYENSDALAAQRLLGLNPATGTKQVSRDYAYTSNRLVSVKQGGTANALESYTWSTSPERLLTVVSSSTTVVEYVWHSAGTDSGKLSRIHTPQGAMGIAVYANPTRQYFYELGMSCTDDAACSAAEVGSKCQLTERGVTDEGVCFRAYRDVAANTTMADWTPSTVTPGNTLAGNATCTTCNDVDEYAWFTGTSNSDLVLKAVRSSDGVWTSYKLAQGGNGLPTQIVENDTDSDGATIPNGGTARVTYITYGATGFPGLVTEKRVKSEIATSGGCTPNDTSACKQTITTYNTDGKVTAVNERGFTVLQVGTEPNDTYPIQSFSYTTGYEVDSKGRVTAIRGARPDDDDVEFTYFGPSSGTASYYMSSVNRRKGPTSYLTSTLNDYDFWGNAKRLTDPNAKAVCRTFDPVFGLLSSSRRVMTGSHTDCTSVGSTDEITSFEYDLYRRLTKTTKPNGNCTTQGFDARGRQTLLRNTDVCANQNGDTIQHTYDADGHLTKSEWYQNGSTLMRRQEYTYADDRRVATEVNPIDTSKKKQWLYKDDGVTSELRFEDFVTAGPSTQWDVDALNRTTAERRYNAAGAAETWTITAGVQLLLPKKLRDNASHDIDLVWDDLSRKVKQVTPETGTIVYVHDQVGNVVKRVEDVLGVDKKSATFTFDTLNRLVSEDYSDASCGTGQGAEIQYSYDALPSGVTCPSGATCNLLAERLAHVKTKIACDAAAADKTFDQATFYSYDNTGRVYQHTVKDDSGRTGTTSYSYDKNSNVLYEVYPSGNYARYEYGASVSYHSDADRPHYLYRNTTMLMNNGYYLPWGPIYSQGLMLSFDHGGTMYQTGFAKYRDLAYRPTLRHVQSTYSTPDQVFKIDYGQDSRGRITKRDFSYGTSGQVDQFFLYDALSRLTCRSRTQQSSCPTTAPNLMENVSYNSSADRASILISNAALPQQTQTYVYSGTKPEQISSISLSGGGQVAFAYDGRGNRLSDDDSNYTGTGDEKRVYTYDARNNLITVSGQYLVAANDLNTYVMTNAYDERNRRIFKSFKDTVTNVEAQWFFYYDQWDKLVQATHIPNSASPSTYSIYEWFYVEGEATAYYQTDFPGGTTTGRFLFGDEQGRPQTAWTFPASGSATRVWEVETGAWGNDAVTIGLGLLQPLRFPGQWADRESASVTLGGLSLRPGLSDNRYRVYDPGTGGFLQPDSRIGETRATYAYASNDPVSKTVPDGLRALPSDSPASGLAKLALQTYRLGKKVRGWWFFPYVAEGLLVDTDPGPQHLNCTPGTGCTCAMPVWQLVTFIWENECEGLEDSCADRIDGENDGNGNGWEWLCTRRLFGECIEGQCTRTYAPREGKRTFPLDMTQE